MPPAAPPRFLFVVMLPAGLSAVSGRMYKVVAGPVRFGKCTTAECFVYISAPGAISLFFHSHNTSDISRLPNSQPPSNVQFAITEKSTLVPAEIRTSSDIFARTDSWTTGAEKLTSH